VASCPESFLTLALSTRLNCAQLKAPGRLCVLPAQAKPLERLGHTLQVSWFAVIRQDRHTLAYQTVQERIAQVRVNVLSKQGAVQLDYGRKKVQQDSKEMVKNSTSCLPPH